MCRNIRVFVLLLFLSVSWEVCARPLDTAKVKLFYFYPVGLSGQASTGWFEVVACAKNDCNEVLARVPASDLDDLIHLKVRFDSTDLLRLYMGDSLIGSVHRGRYIWYTPFEICKPFPIQTNCKYDIFANNDETLSIKLSFFERKGS